MTKLTELKSDKHYLDLAFKIWHINEQTYCLIREKNDTNFLVRILPHDQENKSYWLNNGQTWQNEAFLALNILNDLSTDFKYPF